MPLVEQPWMWAYVGFDTGRRLWFVDLRNYGGTTQVVSAERLIIIRGNISQHQWPDRQRPFWHIREMLHSSDVTDLRLEAANTLVIESRAAQKAPAIAPSEYLYLCYAFSRRTSRGFIEFFDSKDKLIARIEDKWIIAEDVTHYSVGEYPNLRFRVDQNDIAELIITRTAAMIIGKS